MLLTAALHYTQLYAIQFTPWLRELVAGLLPWKTRFNCRYIHVALMVDKVALNGTSVFPSVSIHQQLTVLLNNSQKKTVY